MYSWIWHRLPGGTAAKSAQAFILFLAVVALLFFVIFPWIEPHMPYNNVTVE